MTVQFNESNYIRGNRFKEMCYLEYLPGTVLPVSPTKIFVKGDYINDFIKESIRTYEIDQAKDLYTVVSHNSDYGISDDQANQTKPNIRRWFGQNCNTDHPKFIGIPIGIANPEWENGQFAPIEELIRLRRSDKNLVLMSMSLQTNIKERYPVHLNFINKDWCLKYNGTRNGYLKHLNESQFVISPPGNGIDCVRHWEALYMGTIPVVKKSKAMAFFKDLPILLVDNYEVVTKEFLEEQYSLICRRAWNWNKLTIDYWKDII